MIQIGDEVREMTESEFVEYQKVQADFDAQAEAQFNALEARKAPLRRLGLTEDEINTVLGL